MNRCAIYAFALVSLLLACCAGGGRSDAGREALPIFGRVRIPATMSDALQAREYLRDHYWDNTDFADTLFFAQVDTVSMLWALAEYVSLLDNGDAGRMADLMRRASVAERSFRYFSFLAEQVLYDPNSAWRNDELYIPVLEAETASAWLDEYEKLVPALRLDYALKNRVGRQAEDFAYCTSDGRRGTLYGLRSEFVLLFFSNPGCPMCRSVAEAVVRSEVLSRMIAEGRLTVLTVYPDEDLQAWRDHLHELPSEWTNARDEGCVITSERLYDLKAIPSLYLLDAGKRVMVKDSIDVGQIESAVLSML